jgi:hypothetical protein
MTSPANAKSGSELKGNTLRVYLLLLSKGPCELRDVQRALGFSTPSLASYHLNKLIEAGYASQNSAGQYLSIKDVSGEILEGFTRVGGVLVPQLTFFSILFTVLIVYFGLMSLSNPGYVRLLVAASIALVAIVWYETARVWRRLASWK